MLAYVQWYEAINQSAIHSNDMHNLQCLLTDRRNPLVRGLIALGLIHVISDSNKLGNAQIVCELLAFGACPGICTRFPGVAERYNVIDILNITKISLVILHNCFCSMY